MAVNLLRARWNIFAKYCVKVTLVVFVLEIIQMDRHLVLHEQII